MVNKITGMLLWLGLSGCIVVLDQASKSIAVESLHLNEQIQLLPLFSITLAYNPGAAFSFLSDQSGWQRWFLSVVAVVISIVLTHWLWRLKDNEKMQAWALTLILGGALGNLYDRLVHGYVVDFILLHYKQYYFPAFNLADAAITLGAILLILDTFINKKAERS